MKIVVILVASLVIGSQASYFRNLMICPPMNNFDAEFPSIVDHVLPESEPFFFQTADNFFRNVMKFDDREIERVTADAHNFFKETYGIDFTNAPVIDKNGTRFLADLNVTLFEYELNPALRYSITFNEWTVNGQRRSFCSDNRDGGFLMIFGSDAVLHGTYGGEEGIPIKANERLLYGFYNIPLCRQSPLIIQYQSGSPVRIDTVDGFAIINCDLSNRELGPGLAQGVFRVTPLGDGTIRYNIRNLFTFPPHPGTQRRQSSSWMRKKHGYNMYGR